MVKAIQVRGARVHNLKNIKLIDATPIGTNVRSTVATYAGVHDDLLDVLPSLIYGSLPFVKD